MKHLLLCFLLGTLSITAQRLRPEGIAAAQARIWANYQRAARQAADTLPTLRPFTTLEHDVQQAQAWTLPQWLEPGASLPFFYACKGERPAQGYPLFLYLHGSGAPQSEWTTGWQLAQRFADAPSAYFIPQIPQTGAWYRWYQQSKQWVWERLLRRALAQDSFDPERIYLFGISEGGYGSQRLASFYADYLAGAGPMAAGEPLRNAPPDNCAHLAFSLLTGADDAAFHRNQLTQFTAQAFDSLEKCYSGRYLHRINLIPHHGHGIDYRPTTPWLAQHRRKAQPKWWRWESFPMHGRYREAFYNLRIDHWQRPAPPAATAHDQLQIYDNTAPRRMHTFRIEGQNVYIDIEEVDYAVRNRSPLWHFPTHFDRSFRPAQQGSYTLFLSAQLVDLRRPIRLVVNGHCKFTGRLSLSERHLEESLSLFHDPLRLFPAALSFQL